MRYDEDENRYTLGSGRKFYANCGILGLGPGDQEDLCHGYDGGCSGPADDGPPGTEWGLR